ncbi:MAG TPA: nitroreductase family deazaflavin-dependent oxidoreductase [Thermomicrobiales bacterium]|nr:nitroreductase family deazaflavin-dependent oxidoreductase [Thermomicrobiales bacterium]
MAKTYRVTFTVRLSNALVTALLRAGVPVGQMWLLTVPGRQSGRPRTTPVALGEGDGRRWLIATFGQVNWARNLRAAGGATLARGRRAEAIAVVELSAAEAAPILKRSLAGAPSFIRRYFDVTPASSLAEFAREAPRHPVFEVFAADAVAAARRERATAGAQAPTA